jgi:hypothetical protein
MREWLLLLRAVLMSLSLESKGAMEEVMVGWRDRGRQGGSVNLDGTNAVTTESGDVALPLGPGEWEDGLGIPLCVVCQNVGLTDERPLRNSLTKRATVGTHRLLGKVARVEGREVRPCPTIFANGPP